MYEKKRDYGYVNWIFSADGFWNWPCRTLGHNVTDMLVHLFIQLCILVYRPIYPQTGNRYDTVYDRFASYRSSVFCLFSSVVCFTGVLYGMQGTLHSVLQCKECNWPGHFMFKTAEPIFYDGRYWYCNNDSLMFCICCCNPISVAKILSITEFVCYHRRSVCNTKSRKWM